MKHWSSPKIEVLESWIRQGANERKNSRVSSAYKQWSRKLSTISEPSGVVSNVNRSTPNTHPCWTPKFKIVITNDTLKITLKNLYVSQVTDTWSLILLNNNPTFWRHQSRTKTHVQDQISSTSSNQRPTESKKDYNWSDHATEMHIQNKATDDTWSHLFHCVVIDKVMIVLIQITVNCNTVTLEQKILQRVNTCDAYNKNQHFSIITH